MEEVVIFWLAYSGAVLSTTNQVSSSTVLFKVSVTLKTTSYLPSVQSGVFNGIEWFHQNVSEVFSVEFVFIIVPVL